MSKNYFLVNCGAVVKIVDNSSMIKFEIHYPMVDGCLHIILKYMKDSESYKLSYQYFEMREGVIESIVSTREIDFIDFMSSLSGDIRQKLSWNLICIPPQTEEDLHRVYRERDRLEDKMCSMSRFGTPDQIRSLGQEIYNKFREIHYFSQKKLLESIARSL